MNTPALITAETAGDRCADASGQMQEAASGAVQGGGRRGRSHRSRRLGLEEVTYILIYLRSNEGSVISGTECVHQISLGRTAVFNTFVLRHKNLWLRPGFPQCVCVCVRGQSSERYT